MQEDMIQILKPNGELVDSALEPKLSKEELQKLYHSMVMVRLLDERMLMLQRQGRIGFCVTCLGQEALAGSGLALQKNDWVFPAYREYVVALIRGMPLLDMMGQYFGNELDPLQGRQMPNHFSHKETNFVSISSPIGTQLGHAAGAAIASKIKKDKNVVITYCGDGGTSSTDFHAGLNMAAIHQAPCIFFCSNNQYAISVPVEKQTGVKVLVDKAKAYGMRGVRVDGNDVLAVYQVVKEAADRAREGKGPTFIESVTFRMGPHSSSDDPTKYCPKEKFEAWAKKDPIQRFQVYLEKKGLWNEDFDKKLKETLKQEILEAVEKVSKAAPPKISTIFEDVYQDMPYHLKIQHNELLEEAKHKGEFIDTSEKFPL